MVYHNWVLGGPLLTHLVAEQFGSTSKELKHPRHRLGAASLALDTSTQLVGRAAPESSVATTRPGPLTAQPQV